MHSVQWYIPALAWEKRLGELVQHHVAIAVAAEREQMGATITRHVTQAMRLGRAPSSRSASKLTAEELQMLMIYLKCLVIPVEKESHWPTCKSWGVSTSGVFFSKTVH